ncbi:MAG: chromosomal replication initiator protein DnaA [Planctomycetota bacterium]
MHGPAELAAQWSVVTEHIHKLITPQQFATWFRTIHPVEVSPEQVVLAVPNGFQRDWIGSHYGDVVARALLATFGQRPALSIIVDESLRTEEELSGDRRCSIGTPSSPSDSIAAGPGLEPPASLRFSPPASDMRSAPLPGEARAAPLPSDMRGGAAVRGETELPLNPAYTFENFVVGPSNRLSHAAAMAVADAPGSAYNPFFLTGAVGLGKTHLLQAICHRVLANNRHARILFLSCETFINHFITAVERGQLETFRHRYRNTDVLLIDDVHFLARKERTQEEFFHTFNSLFQSGKQIVLSSDSPPRDIPSLEERLASRFKSGLVTTIGRPDLETRVAIVRSKARIRGHEIPDDVAHYLGERVTTNIRELEGAVVKVIGYSTLSETSISLELARDALRDVVCPTPLRVTMSDVIQVVTTQFGIKVSDLQSRRRNHSVVFPRQVAMYLARRLTTLSLEEIGGHLGGRDHTTVLYGIDRVKSLAASDTATQELITRLSDELGA